MSAIAYEDFETGMNQGHGRSGQWSKADVWPESILSIIPDGWNPVANVLSYRPLTGASGRPRRRPVEHPGYSANFDGAVRQCACFVFAEGVCPWDRTWRCEGHNGTLPDPFANETAAAEAWNDLFNTLEAAI